MSIAHTEGGDTLDSTAPPATIHTLLFPWWKFSFRVVYINKLSILSSSSHSSITRSLKLNNNNKKTPLRITASSLLPKSFLTLYQFHFSVVCDDSLFLTALSYLHLLVFLLLNSVAQSCLTLGDPMDCSTPGLPVHHQPPEFTQTHVHWVSDAIQ